MLSKRWQPLGTDLHLEHTQWAGGVYTGYGCISCFALNGCRWTCTFEDMNSWDRTQRRGAGRRHNQYCLEHPRCFQHRSCISDLALLHSWNPLCPDITCTSLVSCQTKNKESWCAFLKSSKNLPIHQSQLGFDGFNCWIKIEAHMFPTCWLTFSSSVENISPVSEANQKTRSQGCISTKQTWWDTKLWEWKLFCKATTSNWHKAAIY